MWRELACYAAAAALFSAVAGGWPPGRETALEPNAAWMLAAGWTLAAATVAAIALTARERMPALMAAGFFSIAQGAICRVLVDDAGVGPASSTAAAVLPLMGLVAGGALFALAVGSAGTDFGRQLPRATVLLAGGAGATLALSWLLIGEPGAVPSAATTQLLAGISAAAYVYTAIAFARAWRVLRINALAGMAVAAGGLAAGTLTVAGGGLPVIAGWQLEAGIFAFGAIAAVALATEQLRRPGLRTLVLGLALPAAAERMARGQPMPIQRLLEAIETDGEHRPGHVARVAAVAVRVGMRMRLNASHLREVALAAQLHDIGKIAMRRAILCKPGPLTPAEYTEMKQHAAIGEKLLRRIPPLAMAARGVGEHHERWDGAGYPRGRGGAEISLTGRIVAVADVYDNLLARRATREGWTKEDAIVEVVRGSGSQFDPAVVEELLHVLRDTELVAAAAEAA